MIVHLCVSVKPDGWLAKCGAEVPYSGGQHKRPGFAEVGMTGWSSMATCPDCRGRR